MFNPEQFTKSGGALRVETSTDSGDNGINSARVYGVINRNPYEVLRQFEADVSADISVHLERMVKAPLPDVNRQQAEQIAGMFWVAMDRALYAENDPDDLALQLAVLTKASVELGYGEPDARFFSRVSLGLLRS